VKKKERLKKRVSKKERLIMINRVAKRERMKKRVKKEERLKKWRDRVI